MRFTSRLSQADIRLFLIKYGGYANCKIHEEFSKKAIELIMYFSCNNVEYKLFCEDFGMRITKINNNIESNISETIPSADDWFCFLKSKFGKEYMEHFAELMDASHVIFDEAKLISKLSYNEMLIIIRQIISENPGIMPCYNHLTCNNIIEVESFYRSERRFLIKNSTNDSFYLRISDTGVVTPKLRCDSLSRFLRSKFGEEYTKICNENFIRLFSSTGFPKFGEFISSEEASSIST